MSLDPSVVRKMILLSMRRRIDAELKGERYEPLKITKIIGLKVSTPDKRKR